MKKCSIFLIIREMQTEPQWDNYLVKAYEVSYSQKITNTRDKEDLVRMCSSWNTVWIFLKKFKMKLVSFGVYI